MLAGLDLAAEGADAALSRSVARVETDLADWFDAAMDRVTRWYLGRTRVMLFVIGALSALAVNFDVIGHVGRLA